MMADEGEGYRLEPLPRRTLSEIEADRMRQAFDVGFPTPAQLPDRIGLISRIHEAEAPVFVRAKIQLARIRSVRDDKPVSLEDLAPVELLLGYLVSAAGKGRKEIVDIARVQPKEKPRGVLGWGPR